MTVWIIGYWRSESEPHWPDPSDFVDEDWDQIERRRVAAYLSSGVVPRAAAGYSKCRICGQRNGSAEHTDGVYLWPEGLAHYVTDHAVRLPVEFVEHVMAVWNAVSSPKDIKDDWWRNIEPMDRFDAT